MHNLINRSSVPKDPGDNMKAAEDFMQLVLYAHLVASAETDLTGADTVADTAHIIISNYVLLPSHFINKKKLRMRIFGKTWSTCTPVRHLLLVCCGGVFMTLLRMVMVRG